MKRLLFFLILALSLSAHGQILSGILNGSAATAPSIPSVTAIGSNTCGFASSCVITTTASSASGRGVVVLVHVDGGVTVSSVVDNHANCTSYAQDVVSQDGPNGLYAAIYSCKLPVTLATSDTITVTLTGGSNAVMVSAVNIDLFTGVDKTASSTADSGSTTYTSGTTAATTQANEVVIAGLTTISSWASNGAGYSTIAHATDGNSRGGMSEYKVVSSTGAQTAQFTTTAAFAGAAFSIATYK